MALLPLFCAVLLTACSETTANAPESLFKAREWPDGTALAQNPKATQKDVAKYIVRGKAAYNSCIINLDALDKLYNTNKKAEK